MPTHTLLALAALIGTGFARQLPAQDPFEIQVYLYQTVPAGFWNLETHLNHVAKGERAWSGSVAPSHGQTHLTFELTRGMTDYFELAGYLVTARRSDLAGDLVGWRVRPRFRLPESWLPVRFSLAAEVAFPKPAYEENSVTLEVRPIFEGTLGPLLIDINPTVGRALRGPGASDGWDFEPGARVGFAVSPRAELSLEYYGSTGVVTDPLPGDQQVHQFFPGADIKFGPNVIWNLGVGFGATNVGNTLVYKMRFGWMFKG